jgi:hypothetical protein
MDDDGRQVMAIAHMTVGSGELKMQTRGSQKPVLFIWLLMHIWVQARENTFYSHPHTSSAIKPIYFSKDYPKSIQSKLAFKRSLRYKCSTKMHGNLMSKWHDMKTTETIYLCKHNQGFAKGGSYELEIKIIFSLIGTLTFDLITQSSIVFLNSQRFTI